MSIRLASRGGPRCSHLLFVRESWGAQLSVRLWARGLSHAEAQALYPFRGSLRARRGLDSLEHRRSPVARRVMLPLLADSTQASLAFTIPWTERLRMRRCRPRAPSQIEEGSRRVGGCICPSWPPMGEERACTRVIWCAVTRCCWRGLPRVPSISCGPHLIVRAYCHEILTPGQGIVC